MAMIHYLYIGHFVPEDGFVRIRDHRIVAERPLDLKAIAELLKSYLGETATPDFVPEEWGLSISPDCLTCTVDSAGQALELAAHYAELAGASIVDMGSFILMMPSQLRDLAASNDRPVLPLETRRRSSA